MVCVLGLSWLRILNFMIGIKLKKELESAKAMFFWGIYLILTCIGFLTLWSVIKYILFTFILVLTCIGFEHVFFLNLIFEGSRCVFWQHNFLGQVCVTRNFHVFGPNFNRKCRQGIAFMCTKFQGIWKYEFKVMT